MIKLDNSKVTEKTHLLDNYGTAQQAAESLTINNLDLFTEQLKDTYNCSTIKNLSILLNKRQSLLPKQMRFITDNFPNLIILKTRGCVLSNATANILKECTKLERLDLPFAQLGHAINLLTTLNKLETLIIRGNDITDDDLAGFTSFSSLQELDLSINKVLLKKFQESSMFERFALAFSEKEAA